MANLTKTYTIQIEMDAAQQTLADANKRLNELDGRLQGLDRNGDEAKAIVAEMAKIVSEVNSATSAVEGLTDELDNLKPGTIGALRNEAVELEAALEKALKGSAEEDALIQQLGKVKAELKDIDERVDVAFSRDKAGALVDAVSGLAGAFSVATVAAQTFGLSSSTAEEYQQKLTELIAVVQGVEQIHKLTTGEVRQALKNVVTDGRKVILGYLGIGEAATASGAAASTAGKVTRTALISTGIGVLIILVGVLIANWDKLVASVSGGEKVFTKVKAVVSGVLSSMGAAILQTGKLLADLFSGNIVKLKADAAAFGKEVGAAYDKGFSESVKDSNRKYIDQLNEARKRRIDILEAQGKDVRVLRVRQLAEEIKNMKVDSEESKKAQLDKYTELSKLTEQYYKERREAAQANDLAEMQGEITRRQARGEAVLGLVLKQKEEELTQLLNATQLNEAAITAKMAEVEAARLAIIKDATDKEAAIRLARLNADVTIAQAKGKQTAALMVRVKEEELRQLLSAAQRNGAAIIAKEAEITALRIAAAKEAAQKIADIELATLQARIAELQAQGYQAFEEQYKAKEIELKRIEALEGKGSANAIRARGELNAMLLAADKEAADNRYDIRVQEINDELDFQQKMKEAIGETADTIIAASKRPFNIGDTILLKIFGVAPEQLDVAKAVINEAVDSLIVSASMTAGILFDAAYQQVEQKIEAAQMQQQAIEQQLSAATSARQSAEQQLAGATGARRDFLLAKINKEREAEERLAKQKAAAVAAEQKAAKEKARLDKEQQKITAANTAAAAAYNAVLAIQSALEAVKQGSKVPFPANLLAVAAGIAAVGAAVVAARNLGKSFGDGGVLEDGGVIKGGSHASGNDVPIYGGRFRVEGGEMITPVDATQKNRSALDLIRTAGRTRTLLPEDFAKAASFRVLPSPSRTFATGGVLPTPNGGEAGGGPEAGAVGLARLEELEAQQRRTNELLSILVSYGPASLRIGPGEALAIEKQKQVATTSGDAVRL